MPRSKPPRRDRSQGDDSHDRREEGEATGAERLQKVLAAAGIGSRRDCEELIREGRVEVDRQVVTELGTKVDPLQHEIRVDGQPIRKPKRMYFLVNKPMGVVTTNFDPSGRMRVIDLVPTEERVFPVGRLDRYSEGLILVTNDGEFANRLTHPRYGVEKTYLVRVAGEPDQTKLAKLKRGIHLSDGFCQVESIKVKGKRGNSTDMIMVLNEGRNREIRRILARVGHKVLRLKRIAVGPLKLADLPTGAWRKLLPREVELLLEDSYKQEQKAKTAKPKRDERRAQREAAGVDEELDAALLRPGSSLADDHVAEDEELLGEDELAGLGGMADESEGDEESLLADGDFGEDDADEFLAAMGIEDENSDDEDLADEEDEDFEIVDISDDEIERPSRGRQPLGDVLAYEGEEADFDELEDEEAPGPQAAPRRPRGGPQRSRPPRGAAGPRGRRGAEEGRGGRGPRGEGVGRGGAGRSGPGRGGPGRGRAGRSGDERGGAGRAGAGRGDVASRRPGTRRKVKGEGGGPAYRGGFGSRTGREEGGPPGEARGRRPGGKRPPGRSGGAAGGGRARFGEGGGARGERPGGRAPGKRSGPGSRPGGRPQGGPGGGRTGGGRPEGGRPGGGRPGGRPGGRGPAGGGPRGRGPGPGGPRKGGPRKGGPRR